MEAAAAEAHVIRTKMPSRVLKLGLLFVGLYGCRPTTTPRVYMDCQYADTLVFRALRLDRTRDATMAAARRGGVIVRVEPSRGSASSGASIVVAALHTDSTVRPRPLAHTETDSSGYATLSGLSEGTVIVRTFGVGFHAALEHRVRVRAGHVDTLHLGMRLAACRRAAR